jgi:predicted ester cyclase
MINAYPTYSSLTEASYEAEDIFGEDDKVVVRWKWQGTQTGQFTSFPATGKTISNDGMAIFELKEGKIIGSVILTDRLGFWQQLEVIPSDLTALSNKQPHKD